MATRHGRALGRKGAGRHGGSPAHRRAAETRVQGRKGDEHGGTGRAHPETRHGGTAGASGPQNDLQPPRPGPREKQKRDPRPRPRHRAHVTCRCWRAPALPVPGGAPPPLPTPLDPEIGAPADMPDPLAVRSPHAQEDQPGAALAHAGRRRAASKTDGQAPGGAPAASGSAACRYPPRTPSSPIPGPSRGERGAGGAELSCSGATAAAKGPASRGALEGYREGLLAPTAPRGSGAPLPRSRPPVAGLQGLSRRRSGPGSGGSW